MKLGDKIMKLRKEKGLSQEELGNMLDVSRQTVSKWELDQSTPDYDNLTKLADTFNMSVDELLNEKSDTKTNEKKEKTNSKSPWVTILIVVLIGAIVFVLIKIALGIFIVNKTGSLFGSMLDEKDETVSTSLGIFKDISSKILDSASEQQEDEKNEKIELFNNKFSFLYSGELYSTSLNKLLTVIKENNATNDRKVEVKYNDNVVEVDDLIKELANSTSSSKKYYVSYDYGEDGYIIRVVIEKGKMSEFELMEFNSAFETSYFGNTDGFFMENFFNTVIKSNQSNPDHIITVKYGDIETSDKEEIKSLKSKFKNGKKYDIDYEYDEDGLIVKAIIK